MRVENIRFKVAGLLLFTAACVGMFLYLFQLAGGRLRLEDPYNAKVLVPDAFNIVLNSDVRRDGVTIGRVRGIEPKGGMGEIKFELEEDGQQQLFRDATVRVRTKTLVGESYLDVEPGTPTSGKLPSGSTLPMEATQEAVPLERILESLNPETRREIRRNMKGLGDGLDGRGDELNELFGAFKPTVASGGKLVAALKPQKQALANLLQNTGEVLEAFGERRAAFRSLVTDARIAAEAAVARDEQLKESFEELPATLRRAESTVGKLASFSGRSTPVVRDLKVASADLEPALRDLGPAARDGRTLFRELNPFLTAIDPLLGELSPATKSLGTVVAPLNAMLRQVNPALRYLEPYSRRFGTFFANTGSITDSKRDAVGNKGRVFVMLGIQQYTALSKEQQAIANALIEGGALGMFKGSKRNPYPRPDEVAIPRGEFNGEYPRVTPDK